MGLNLTRVRLNRLSTGCLHGFDNGFNRVSTVFSTGFQQSFQQGFNRLFNRVSTGCLHGFNRLFNRLFNRVSTVFSTCYTQVFHQPVGVENVKKGLQIMCIYPYLNRCCIQLLNHQVEHHVLTPG